MNSDKHFVDFGVLGQEFKISHHHGVLEIQETNHLLPSKDEYIRQYIDTKEQAIIDALVKLGWSTPEKTNKYQELAKQVAEGNVNQSIELARSLME